MRRGSWRRCFWAAGSGFRRTIPPMKIKSFAGAACLIAMTAAWSSAEVLRVEVKDRQDIPQYGYEQLTAKAYFAVDPKDPRNAVIADIDKAPKNKDGLVEFSADLLALRPK